jgi:outer membrane receptor protein involved in Fe transport
MVLLNGRRLPNGGLGGDDSVDLGMIPLSMIERIEVLTSGASAIYGADAVAGVVDVITRKAASGLELRLDNTLTERGDGHIAAGQFLAGRDIAGGSWLLGGEWVQQKAVTMDARAYSAVPLEIRTSDLTLGLFGSPATPDGMLRVPAGNALGLDPGRYFRIPGASGQTAAAYEPFSFDARFNYAPYNYLQTPNERGAVWLQGTQPLDNGMTVFVEGLWHARQSSQRLAPTPYFSDFDPAPLLPDGSFGIPADNFYNPFGVPLAIVRRRFVELPERRLSQDIKGWRTLVGIRGDWRDLHWEMSAVESRSAASSMETGLPSAVRIVPALGPSGPDVNGRIVCGVRDASGIVPAANVIADCVPLDLFNGAGTITREQADYLAVALHDHGGESQRLIAIDLQGPWGRLPAGRIQWALGAEYRRESGHYVFDPLRKAGVVSVTADSDLDGASFNARELYLEGRAPLLAGRTGARALDVTAGVRVSRFSSFGSDTTWQAGLRWQPVDAWSLRGTYAQVFRVPNLQELYRAKALQRTREGTDPCGNEPTPAQQVNCAANGVPGGAYVSDPEAEWEDVTGGNAALSPERGTSFNAGIEFRPVRWSNLRLNLDFFHVELSGFIEDPSVDDVLGECANRGTAAVCALISRASDGSLRRVDTLTHNFGRAVSSGYDFGGRLEFDHRGMQYEAGLSATYLARRDTEVFAGGEVTRGAGHLVDNSLAFPHWRAEGHVQISRSGWHASYSLLMIGPYSECGVSVNDTDTLICYGIAPRLYHDVEGGYTSRHGIEWRLGVTNLTNSRPPFVNTANANTEVATYRLLGRTYFLSVRYRAR